MEKVFKVFPLCFSKEAATLATKLESSPPESRQPIGLSDISLSSTAFLNTATMVS
jgi:hypothetical protein